MVLVKGVHMCSDTTIHIGQCQESFLIPEYPDNTALFLSKTHNKEENI